MAEKKQTQKAEQDLRTLDTQGLTAKVAELKQQLVEQQRAHAAQELPGTHVIRKTRKDIARALTLLGEVERKPQEAQKEEVK